MQLRQAVFWFLFVFALSWAGWAALLIGAASAPQAAASGFRSPYMIPDTATAALGILLAITILATAGQPAIRRTPPVRPG